MYECGDGRLSEILSRWLQTLGVSCRSLLEQEECESEETVSRRLVDTARRYYPLSSSVSVILLHLVWDQLKTWSRDRSKLEMLQDIVWSVWSVSNPQLRLKFLSLIWRTYFQEMIRDCAKLTDTFSKSVQVNRETRCWDVLMMRPETVSTWLSSLGGCRRWSEL